MKYKNRYHPYCDDLDAINSYRIIYLGPNDYYASLQDELIPFDEYNLILNYCNLYRNEEFVKKGFTTEEAKEIAHLLNIDFSKVKYDLEQFRMGLDVELEHGRKSPNTNVTNDDPIITGKIALAHLNEIPDYYTRLKKLETDAKAYWSSK